MTRAMWITIGLVAVLTAWIFVQGILVGRLSGQPNARRWGPLFFLVPPLAPFEAFRSGRRLAAVTWVVLGVVYVALQSWARQY